MKVNPNIFRAYDIRGIYPQEINEKTAYLIGQAFVKFLEADQRRLQRRLTRMQVVVGRDGRLSSPVLFRNLVQGITDQGANVIDIGLSTTPLLYFAVAYYGYDGGINITASHNSSEYNGFKIVREKALPISEKTGLKKIQKLTKIIFGKPRIKGKIKKKKIVQDYIRFNLRGTNLTKLKPLKIVIDTANAVPGIIIPEIFKKTSCKIYHLFKKLDGSFPNHPPDPLMKENLKALQKEVKNKKADLGVAFDGDGDRIIFVDEKGKIISGDLITALVVSLILEKNPGGKILYDLRSSRVVSSAIKKQDGVPVIYRVGHSFIKEKMRKENIIFAGEFSGHYYHKDHYFCEAPLFVFFKILETVSESQKSLSQLIKPLKVYFHSGEINFKVKDKKKILSKLEKIYKKGHPSHLDGLRIDFKDWWFLVRPSHTEPVLRLIVEGNTKDLMEAKKKELTQLIIQ